MPLTRHRGRHRTPTALLLVLVVLNACGGNGEQPAPHATPSASTSTPEPPGPNGVGLAKVYFLADTPAGIRLAYEEQQVRRGRPAGHTAAMVRAMIAGPIDPDYVSPWNPRTRVLAVDRHGDVVTVDLSPAARRANIGSEGAERMVQQLVYTVNATGGGTSKVRLLIGGQPAGDLWGTVSWTTPIGPADPLDVLMPVQIEAPADGSSHSGPVAVIGSVTASRPAVRWRVLGADGTVVASGTAKVHAGSNRFRFTVDLAPGAYTVEALVRDPSGAARGTPTTDTKTVTVR